ncbi:MAG: M23 family metallopeptidase [Mycobacteriales bacterium]|nr:M23 family metallopeptidase [Mycobacteriales bacterium]
MKAFTLSSADDKGMRRALLSLLALATLAGGAQTAQALVDPGTGTSYELTSVTVPMTFPVAGRVSFTDNYLVCRSGCTRKHMGQDLMGAKMTPLVAAFDGVVTTLQQDGGSGNYVGITADRGPAKGWTVLYLHVNNDTPGTDDGRGSAQWAFPKGIERGARVLAGQLVGWLGDSGNAESTGAHLHVELRKGTGWSGVVHNAYPSLIKARRLSAPTASGPHPDGSVVKHPTGALFVLEAGRKRPVTPTVLAARGLALSAAVPMTAAESLGYPTTTPLPLRDGTVVRDPAGTTWLVHAGSRSRAGRPALQALFLTDPRVFAVSDADLARLPEVPLPESPVYPGALVRVDGDPAVHRVGEDGALHAVSAQALASHGLSSRDVALLPAPELPLPEVLDVPVDELLPEGLRVAALLEALPVGDPLGLRDGTVVQTPSHKVAVISGGYVRRLYDSRMVASYGYSGRPRMLVSDALLATYPVRALTG